ncbi:MAG: sugar phosphate isomerase/epimerase [Deltaproteobacteria bacterium]|nr:sugar phosphate isomerase/epimerase [Deltaproteobacteria bacterium]
MKDIFFTHVPYRMLVERIDDVVFMGLNPEVYLDADSLDSAKSDDVKRVSAMLKENGLRTTVHGPFMELSPGSPDPKVRDVSRDRFLQAIEVAAPLSPVRIVLHAAYDSRRFDGDVGLWLEGSKKTWPGAIKAAKAANTVIALENVFEEGPGPMKALMDAFTDDAENFGVCIDAGHLNIFSEASTSTWFSEVGNRVREVHLHDNHGSVDEHLPIGEGVIDFKFFFSHLRKHAIDYVHTIEPHGEEILKRALAAVRQFVGSGAK